MTSGDGIPHGSLGGYTNRRCRCDECRAAYAAWRRSWRAANRERSREYDRRYLAANREKSREYQRAWRAANPNPGGSTAWYRANQDRARAAARAWELANPERVLLKGERRRARKAAAGIFEITLRDWQSLVDRHRGCCAYCGENRTLTQDHVVPLARGGRHSIGNLLPACTPCNSSKGALLLIEWRGRQRI